MIFKYTLYYINYIILIGDDNIMLLN